MEKSVVPIFGKSVRVCFLKDNFGKKENVRLMDGMFNVNKWLRDQAGRFIRKRVRMIAQKNKLSFKRIFIKEQRRCWGSCSAKKNLNFNWRLIHLPLPLIDYVIVHELMHLKELNHSRVFWKNVETACPEYEIRRKTLKKIAVYRPTFSAMSFRLNSLPPLL